MEEISKSYLISIMQKVVTDVEAKELEYGQGAKVSISLGLTEALALLDCLESSDAQKER